LVIISKSLLPTNGLALVRDRHRIREPYGGHSRKRVRRRDSRDDVERRRSRSTIHDAEVTKLKVAEIHHDADGRRTVGLSSGRELSQRIRSPRLGTAIGVRDVSNDRATTSTDVRQGLSHADVMLVLLRSTPEQTRSFVEELSINFGCLIEDDDLGHSLSGAETYGMDTVRKTAEVRMRVDLCLRSVRSSSTVEHHVVVQVQTSRD